MVLPVPVSEGQGREGQERAGDPFAGGLGDHAREGGQEIRHAGRNDLKSYTE
jgi:hypothetical protein